MSYYDDILYLHSQMSFCIVCITFDFYITGRDVRVASYHISFQPLGLVSCLWSETGDL